MRPLQTTIRTLLAVFAASVAVTPSAGAAVLHVTDGPGNCTTRALGCTLQTALGAAAAGDTVRVHSGVHGVTGIVTDGAPGVSIEGAPDESRPVIAISGPASGLQLLNGTDLSAVDVVSTGTVGITALGGIVERVRVSANGPSIAGVRLGSGAILRNSTVSVNGTGSVGVLVSTGGGLTQLRGTSILATGSLGSALHVEPSGPGFTSSLRAVNSVLRGYGGALDVRAVTTNLETATVVLDHSATTDAGRQAVGPGSAIDDSRKPMTAEPLFQDRGNMDLRQQATSPTIDAGTADLDGDGEVDSADATAAGETDLDGTPRQLGLPDIGSDEREMPPIVLSAEPLVTAGRLTLRVVVQPRGLETLVTAEWSAGVDDATTSTTVAASGNDPVAVDILISDVPAGTKIAIRARASNSAGTTTSQATTVATPSETTSATTTTESPTAPTATPAAPITGGLPTLVKSSLRSHWGIVDLTLRCRHTVPCRGIVVITRLGKSTRWSPFQIAAGATATVKVSLTSSQTRRLRAAGKRGVRSLLEVRSTQMGSTFSALRLVAKPDAAKPRAK